LKGGQTGYRGKDDPSLDGSRDKPAWAFNSDVKKAIRVYLALDSVKDAVKAMRVLKRLS